MLIQSQSFVKNLGLNQGQVMSQGLSQGLGQSQNYTR